MDLQSTLNHYGKARQPFFFCISYDMKTWDVIPLNELPNNISYEISHNLKPKKDHTTPLKKEPIPFREYEKMFQHTQDEIKAGNTYLLNLTSQTNVETSLSLGEIYDLAEAKYKLLYKDSFVSFSPETFIQIKNNKIFAFPMKGTIDADIENAHDLILHNQKELAEHTMIVDLLRNDLNIISKNVKVDTFRYIDKIAAGEKNLLQVSSIISGELSTNWYDYIGDYLIKILPAGSITGTPKKSTVSIIDEIEKYKRDFFTGVWGIFDGETLDSAVLIRFIEKTKLPNRYIYKSGGGITIDSDPKDEYNEMIDKVYIP